MVKLTGHSLKLDNAEMSVEAPKQFYLKKHSGEPKFSLVEERIVTEGTSTPIERFYEYS